MSWTDERIALLKKMWKDGKSAADIAKMLAKGVTRNAVIGKAHRMGLSGRPVAVKKTAAPAASSGKAKKPPAREEAEAPKKDSGIKKPAVKAGAKVAPPAPVQAAKPAPAPALARKKGFPSREATEAVIIEKETPPPDGGVALIDLTERMCKWPIGDPREAEFTFCGRSPTRPGTPYCMSHASMAYQSSSRRGHVAVAVEEKEDPKETVDEVDEDDIGTVA